MAKMAILFDGFADLAYRIDAMGGDLHLAVDEALTETQKLVQENVSTAAEPYAKGGRKGYATGAMYNSILDDARIKWNGNVAEVDVGFDLTTKGGYHSIFMMYGTPRIAKDTKLFNSIKGTRIRNQIAELQKEIMMKHLNLGGG